MIRTLSIVCMTLLACRAAAPTPTSAPAPGPAAPGPAAPAPAPAPAADDRGLTHGECAEAIDHAIALFDADPAMSSAAQMMRDGRERFITQCEGGATLRDHRCVMDAKTAHELGLCPQPGTR